MSLYYIFPEIILFCGALTILMLDVFFAKKVKNFFLTTHSLSLAFVAGSLFILTDIFDVKEAIYSNMLSINPLLSFIKVVILCLLALTISLSLKYVSKHQKMSAEFIALYMLSAVGAMVLVSSHDFLTFYLGLELHSLPLYLLAALNRRSARSSESGMKYFILGCLASGILLFGISIVYGFSGTTNFAEFFNLYFRNSMNPEVPAAVLFGFILILSSLFFKVSAAPFHMWAPDVYQGSPTTITTFFATLAKFTAVFALLKLYFGLIGFFKWPGIENIFIFTGVLSLIVGSLGAIFQTNLKRLLAYSSIGHVGFILLGMSSFHIKSFIACLTYITIYSIITIGSFAFLNLLKKKGSDADSDENDDEIYNINNLAGLAKTNPLCAFFFAALLFSSAGIPPMAGFFSKFYIISAVALSQNFILALVAVLFSVVSAFYYLRIVKIMYFDDTKNVIEIDNSASAKVILAVAALANILLIAKIDTFVLMLTTFTTS